MALKCVYTLLKRDKLTDRPKIFGLLSQIKTTNTETNIHILKIYSVLVDGATIDDLMNVYMKTVGTFLTKSTNKVEFEFAYALYGWMLEQLKEQQLERFNKQHDGQVQ
jgi:hypothetical protein